VGAILFWGAFAAILAIAFGAIVFGNADTTSAEISHDGCSLLASCDARTSPCSVHSTELFVNNETGEYSQIITMVCTEDGTVFSQTETIHSYLTLG